MFKTLELWAVVKSIKSILLTYMRAAVSADSTGRETVPERREGGMTRNMPALLFGSFVLVLGAAVLVVAGSI
ncbi:MAG TPA: hypothetical protein PK264_10180, partial [Hyphomicrobiaceae bacterium]|nr:hypothetical protein [Hyphomicrobiaceae bacterium]